MDKLVCAVTVKLSPLELHQLQSLASAAGLDASKYMRLLLGKDVAAEKRRYDALASIFGAPEASYQENRE